MTSTIEEIPVQVGVVDKGIGINWRFLGLKRHEFKEFLNEMLIAAGFHSPETVYIERNKTVGIGESPAIDWFRPRISAEECELHKVVPLLAATKIRDFLTSEKIHKKYGISFLVG